MYVYMVGTKAIQSKMSIYSKMSNKQPLNPIEVTQIGLGKGTTVLPFRGNDFVK